MDESALRMSLRAFDTSWSPLEHLLWACAFVVFAGVAAELIPVVWDFRSDRHDFFAGIVRPPDKPSFLKFAFEFAGAALVTLGVLGELVVGIKMARVETGMRDDTAKLVAIIDGKAEAASERASSNEIKAADLSREAEDERSRRIKIEAVVAWRALTDKQERDIGNALSKFAKKALANVGYDASSTEAGMFADDIARALRFGHITTTSPGGYMQMAGGGAFNRPILPVETGVVVQCTKYPHAFKFADELVKELNRLGFDARRQTSPPFDTRVRVPMVWVSVEPRPKGPQGKYKLQAQRGARAKSNTKSTPRP